jgi:molybdopterin converting factor small subunit
MATLYFNFNLAKKIGKSEAVIEAKTVGELFEKAKTEWKDDFILASTTSAFVVNGININYLNGKNTALKANDEIWMIQPSAGG